jgi:hypothetical protein
VCRGRRWWKNRVLVQACVLLRKINVQRFINYRSGPQNFILPSETCEREYTRGRSSGMCYNIQKTQRWKKTSSPDKQQSSRKNVKSTALCIFSPLNRTCFCVYIFNIVSRGWLIAKKGYFPISPYCFSGFFWFDIISSRGGHLENILKFNLIF